MTRWILDVIAGHDDQVLADPERLGAIEAVSEAYFTGSSRFFLRWENLNRADRLEMMAEAAGTTYGSKVDGEDSDLRLTGAYRHRLNPRLALDVSGFGWRFRREEQADDRNVYDLNMFRSDTRLGWVVGGPWLATLGLNRDWISFPDRIRPGSQENERQRLFGLSMVGMRRFGAGGGFLAAEVSYRWASSNADSAEYTGPVATLRMRTGLLEGLTLSAYAAFGHRSYDRFVLFASRDGVLVDTGETRSDDTWQFGVTLERRIAPRMRVYGDGIFLHQASNVSLFDFDQSRIAIGVSIDLLEPSRRSPALGASPSPTLAPQLTGDGVRFRIRPGQVGSVSVVGGFNGWDAARHPLTDSGESGVWETVLPLGPGIWRYAFVVDGEWISPLEHSDTRRTASGAGMESSKFPGGKEMDL